MVFPITLLQRVFIATVNGFTTSYGLGFESSRHHVISPELYARHTNEIQSTLQVSRIDNSSINYMYETTTLDTGVWTLKVTYMMQR